MKIAVPREAAEGERRVAATRETVKKLIGLGGAVVVEAGAGTRASIADAAFADAGASVADRGSVLAGADLVLAVQEGPEASALGGVKPGAARRHLEPLRQPRAHRRLRVGRTPGAGHGVHAAHHARAVDGRAVEPSQSRRLQGRARCGRRIWSLASDDHDGGRHDPGGARLREGGRWRYHVERFGPHLAWTDVARIINCKRDRSDRIHVTTLKVQVRRLVRAGDLPESVLDRARSPTREAAALAVQSIRAEHPKATLRGLAAELDKRGIHSPKR